MFDLDDPSFIRSRDGCGMLGLIDRFPSMLVEGYSSRWVEGPENICGPISNVLMVGFGGSAISGDILRDWLIDVLHVPFEVHRGLRLPRYVSDETLAIIVSYSGETLETLQLLSSSLRRGCKTLTVTSGGLMGEICIKRRVPMLKVDGGLPPRAALPLLLSATLKALTETDVVPEMSAELYRTSSELEDKSRLWRVEVESANNPCKRLATELLNTIPVIYSLEGLTSVARRFKDQFNENSKIPAKFDLIPEACHNEVEGWSKDFLSNYDRPRLSTIFIRDFYESPDESARIDAFKEQIQSVGLKDIFEVWSDPSTRLGRILHPILFGDYLSTYLAVARGVDPTSIPAISAVKGMVESRTGLRVELEKMIL